MAETEETAPTAPAEPSATQIADPGETSDSAKDSLAKNFDDSLAKLVAESEAQKKALETRFLEFEEKEAARRKKEDEEKEKDKSKSTTKDDDQSMVFYSGPEKPPKIIPEVNYVEWLDYKSTYMDRTEEYAIDVLVGPPVLFWQRSEVRMLIARDETKKDQDLKEVLNNQLEMPERLRVNSMLLVRIFAMVAWDTQWELKPMVFMRPFKFFYYYEQHLRQWRDDLEEKWENGPPKKDVKTEENGKEATNTKVEEKEAKSEEKQTAEKDPSEATSDSGDSKVQEDNKQPPPPPPPPPPAASSSGTEEKKDKMDEHDTHSYEALLAMRGLVDFIDRYVLPTARSLS